MSDLFGEDEYFIIGHNTRILIMDRRYSVVASPSSDAIFGNIGCTLTVANGDSDAEEKFKFVEGKSGSCQWVKRK